MSLKIPIAYGYEPRDSFYISSLQTEDFSEVAVAL